MDCWLEVAHYEMGVFFLLFILHSDRRCKLTTCSNVVHDQLTIVSASQEIPLYYGTWGTLPRAQEPTTCHYPEPDQSGPCPRTPLLEDTF